MLLLYGAAVHAAARASTASTPASEYALRRRVQQQNLNVRIRMVPTVPALKRVEQLCQHGKRLGLLAAALQTRRSAQQQPHDARRMRRQH
jgi:hypothetical protein